MQYLIKPCVRGFSEMPTDNEFNSGDLALIVDDYNPGCGCPCLPACFKRLTLTAKVGLHVVNLTCLPTGYTKNMPTCICVASISQNHYGEADTFACVLYW